MQNLYYFIEIEIWRHIIILLTAAISAVYAWLPFIPYNKYMFSPGWYWSKALVTARSYKIAFTLPS